MATWNIGSGQTYADFAAWITAVAPFDCTAEAGDSEVIIHSDLTSQTNLDLSGFTTDATHRLIFRPPNGSEHNGDKAAGVRISDANNDNVAIFNAPDLYGEARDLIFEVSGSSPVGSWRTDNADMFEFHRCMFVAADDGGGDYSGSMLIGGTADHGPNCYNCVFDDNGLYNASSKAIEGQGGFAATGGKIYNCTIIGFGTGIQVLNSLYDVRNTVVYGADLCFDVGSDGGFAATSTNNASSDATAPGTNPVTSITTAAFVDYANDDYHPASGGVLEDAGADLSGATPAITDDIAGTSRSAPYDIGAYEGQAADTDAPTVSSASVTATGSTTADLSVSTDEGNGTLYWVVSTSATTPNITQIQAGQDSSGQAAAASGTQVVLATGTQTASATGLLGGQTYYAYFQQQDDATNDSAVVQSSSFTTPSSDSTPPTLSSITTTANNNTTITAGATSDEVGTGYIVVLASGSPAPTGTQVKAGTDGADSTAITSNLVACDANVAFSISFSGLSGGTTYDVYVTAEDSAFNVQETPLSASVTTAPDPAVTITLLNKADSAAVSSATVTYSIRNSGVGIAQSATLSGTTTTDPSGVFNLSDPVLAGPVSVTLTVDDGDYAGHTLYAPSVPVS